MSAANVFDEYLGNVVAQAALTKAQFEEAVLKAALHVGVESVTIKWTPDDSGTRFDLPTVERYAKALAVVEAARALIEVLHPPLTSSRPDWLRFLTDAGWSYGEAKRLIAALAAFDEVAQ